MEIRVYGPLNDFLPPEWRGHTVTRELASHTSVKDAIEALGVPHPEVGIVLVNGELAEFGKLVGTGDRISAYPAMLGFAAGNRRPVRFVLDVHLGRLAAYLRMSGFDAVYRNDYADEEIARIAGQEDRIVLTRDIGLLKRRNVERGYWLRHTDSGRQLEEIVERYGLPHGETAFSRCLACNGRLTAVSKDEVLEEIPPRVREHFEEFRRCGECRKVYWPGSHYRRMRERLGKLSGAS